MRKKETTSMNILPKIQEKINTQILPLVRSKWKPMFKLGINGLSFKPFVSLNSNARTSRDNSSASEMQMYRLISKDKINNIFSSILLNFFKIDNQTKISIDFTIFHPFAVLYFGIQTEEGRSIPIWFDIIKYPIEKDSQNIFILDVIREFLKVVDCKPKIVLDRGFIGKYLIHGFLDLGLTFYVRMKSGKHWLVEGKDRRLKRQHQLDRVGVMYGEKIRVIRSSKTLAKKLKAKEPWYIITNDFESTREEILKTYYYRFEIEETFKDLKHIFNSSQRYLTKLSTLKTILWFQTLGIWLFWVVGKLTKLLIKTTKNIKKKLSWIRQVFEQLTKKTTQLILPEQNWNSITPYPNQRKEKSFL